jgi:hypothetical protein
MADDGPSEVACLSLNGARPHARDRPRSLSANYSPVSRCRVRSWDTNSLDFSLFPSQSFASSSGEGVSDVLSSRLGVSKRLLQVVGTATFLALSPLITHRRGALSSVLACAFLVSTLSWWTMPTHDCRLQPSPLRPSSQGRLCGVAPPVCCWRYSEQQSVSLSSNAVIIGAPKHPVNAVPVDCRRAFPGGVSCVSVRGEAA